MEVASRRRRMSRMKTTTTNHQRDASILFASMFAPTWLWVTASLIIVLSLQYSSAFQTSSLHRYRRWSQNPSSASSLHQPLFVSSSCREIRPTFQRPWRRNFSEHTNAFTRTLHSRLFLSPITTSSAKNPIDLDAWRTEITADELQALLVTAKKAARAAGKLMLKASNRTLVEEDEDNVSGRSASSVTNEAAVTDAIITEAPTAETGAASDLPPPPPPTFDPTFDKSQYTAPVTSSSSRLVADTNDIRQRGGAESRRDENAAAEAERLHRGGSGGGGSGSSSFSAFTSNNNAFPLETAAVPTAASNEQAISDEFNVASEDYIVENEAMVDTATTSQTTPTTGTTSTDTTVPTAWKTPSYSTIPPSQPSSTMNAASSPLGATGSGSSISSVSTGGKSSVAAFQKSSIKDIYTIYDNEAQDAIQTIVQRDYPTHSFLGEESVAAGPTASEAALQRALLHSANTNYLWICDPIDGTANFASGLALSAVTIAVVYKGTVMVGLVYDPYRNDMFTAIKEQGAYLNDVYLLQVAQRVTTVRDAVINAGCPVNVNAFACSMRGIHALNGKTRGLRMIACSALTTAWIAAGRLTAHFGYDLNSWDLAAGALLIQEAGGLVTDLYGMPYQLSTRNMLCSNGLVHYEILDILQDASAVTFTRSK